MRTFSRIVFLDIDGVLQPGTQHRFEYQKDIEGLCLELEGKCDGRYPYTQWCPSREICDMDLAAVYYDWDRDAVERLRYALELLDAGIVLSTNWREDRGFKAMSALLAIHGLDHRLCGYTETPYMLRMWGESHKSPEDQARYESATEALKLGRHDLAQGLARTYDDGSGHVYVTERTAEIREYLDRHPEIKSFAAVDDRDLARGLDGHFVETSDSLQADELVQLLDILAKEDGPYPLPESCRTENMERLRREAVPLEDEAFFDSTPIHCERRIW